jgi:hypothetical protein
MGLSNLFWGLVQGWFHDTAEFHLIATEAINGKKSTQQGQTLL